MLPSRSNTKISSGCTVALSVPPPGLSNTRSVPGTRTDTCPNIPIVPCKLSIRVKVAVLRRNAVSSSMNAPSRSCGTRKWRRDHQRRDGANQPGLASRQAGLEKGDELRRGDDGRRGIGRWLLAVHEAVLGVGIILPNGWRRALVQVLLKRRIGLHAGDVIVAGLDDVNGATDIGRERDRVLLLVGKPRVFDRRIGGGASLDPLVLCRGYEHIAAAETEAEHTDRGES